MKASSLAKPLASRAVALAACPVQAPGATVARKDSGARISVALPAPRWANFLFGSTQGASKAFELDEMGLTVWDACDGTASVRQIIERIADQYRLNLREAEVSTLQFLQTLTRKRLIGMSLAAEGES